MKLRDGISRVVSHPRVFRIQTVILGGNRLAEAMQPAIETVTKDTDCGTVLDVGGGTASARSLWPAGWTYISIDPDHRVVEGEVHGGVSQIVGDATKLGFLDNSMDVVLMKNVSHHLNDAMWIRALAEVRRILKPDGWLLFVDGTWNGRRLISRLGWALDAGRWPRPFESLQDAIEVEFDVETVTRLTLLHDSIIMVNRPQVVAREIALVPEPPQLQTMPMAAGAEVG